MMAHGHVRVSSAEPRSHDPNGNTSVRHVVKSNQMKALTISKRLTGKSLKRKGDTFERDLARWFNIKLFGGTERVTRAPLSGGGYTSLNSGGADLIGLPLVFVEAKRTEKLNIREALRQAIGNVFKRQTPDVPVDITRRSQENLEHTTAGDEEIYKDMEKMDLTKLDLFNDEPEGFIHVMKQGYVSVINNKFFPI